jgi:tetratricopeptide (TPR) repeat protein
MIIKMNAVFRFHNMTKICCESQLLFFILLSIILASCKGKNSGPSKEKVSEINLKRGEVAVCGRPGKQFGTVEFETSCNGKVKQDFNLAVALLHSFEYDEAEKVFAKIIDKEPKCAMAYWGVAMCNYHPLWTPPSASELNKGAKAIEIARSITQKSKRETGYIDAVSAFYKDWDKADHHTRCLNFEKGMEELYTAYPADKEAAIFYALALDAAADPADKSFKNQKKAGSILNSLYPGEPNHPGIAHYIIHTYDYPELAILALPMARKYASIAPSSAHALHMPSHIFTRLGLWDESITSNLSSMSSALCYAEITGVKGHWGEELHSLDYLVYAYLQKGENKLAKEQCDYLKTINDVYPVDFKAAYAFAAVPSRYLLENKSWNEAADLKIHPANFPWKNFQWQVAIVHFTRLMGSVHIGHIDSAKAELKALNTIHDMLSAQKDAYKANQVQIQIKTGQAWIAFKEGKNNEAMSLMNVATAMEDKTEKHPVTPCEVIPARELLGDMLLQMNKPAQALEAYEADLKKHPKRFNGVYGAGLAAEKAGNKEKAGFYYRQLLTFISKDKAARPELAATKLFLRR